MKLWKRFACLSWASIVLSYLAMSMAVAADRHSGFEAWWGVISMLTLFISLFAGIFAGIFAVVVYLEERSE